MALVAYPILFQPSPVGRYDQGVEEVDPQVRPAQGQGGQGQRRLQQPQLGSGKQVSSPQVLFKMEREVKISAVIMQFVLQSQETTTTKL